MNIESILKYQKKDEELYKVEQKLENSPYRKKANELLGVAKRAQTTSIELENEAEKVIAEIADIKNKYAANKSKTDEVLASNLEGLSVEDIDKLSALKSKLVSNLNILEKMLQKSAENVNHILAEYNKTKKSYDDAKTQYAVCKEKIDEETKLLSPEKEKIKKELAALEKDVDAKLLEEYKKKRADNIFPVVVPLENNNFCGRCRMELPKAATSQIKEMGVIICEHCKRYVYKP